MRRRRNEEEEMRTNKRGRGGRGRMVAQFRYFFNCKQLKGKEETKTKSLMLGTEIRILQHSLRRI